MTHVIFCQPMSSSCCSSEPAPSSRPPISAYTPLFVIVLLTALAAMARQFSTPSWRWMDWMHDFMGFFLVVFSMVKFFDLKAFATGFGKYDLLASRSRFYALLYPFLELGLGLAYLAQWQPRATYLATMILLGFGTLGVVKTMRKGERLNCACMGGILSVPVSTVTLAENLSMSGMALVMLVS
jgi:hypothetical protein